IAKKYNLYVIEDAAESLGSTYNGIRSGKFGIGSVFSFHRTKTITTGEGGMLLLDDKKLYDRCMFLRDHGRSKTIPYYVEEVAFKYMPFNIQAALGYAQLQRIDDLIKIKRHHLEVYKNALGNIPGFQFNHEPAHVFNGCWITALVTNNPNTLSTQYMLHKLGEKNIPVRPFFYPLSSLPAYNQKYKYMHSNTNAYSIASRGINLPGAMNLTDEQLQYVCDEIKLLCTNV
ncbi:MAG TPA: DegT/DnrJ/EryC1/StrS family aminotransferase, partial [Flavobacteriaceae bacterium]|nr:DegT/DnrJ/EryC1/StrS family aminotransferase [Flavobacteriaceae bacterium]